MSVDGWSRLLVLGGIRSGKSEFAESLLKDVAFVRYVATATTDPDDPEWTARIDAHRLRRPAGWTTEEANADPSRLAELITGAGPGDTLLVDDLGGWVTVLLDPAHQPADDVATIDELGTAIRNCPARLVLVSPEVGLSTVPVTPLGRAFVDALGTTNRAVADACDAAVLVIAGQPAWIKIEEDRPAPAPTGADQPGVPAQPDRGAADRGGAGQAAPATSAWTDVVDAMPQVLRPTLVPAPQDEPAPASTATGWTAPTMALPMVATGLVIQAGMDLPMPDEYAGPAALDRLGTLDLPGSGLGHLDRVVSFAAATQGTATPRPWRSARVLLLHGDHTGGAAAGTVPGESARRAEQARQGIGPIARLAAEAGASLQVVEAPLSRPAEEGPTLTVDEVEAALRYGWRLAEEAAEAGVDLLVLAACGDGADAAAAAVLAATSGAEPAAVLGRVVALGGQVDDAAWMRRCAAVRDAMHRTRRSPRDAKDILAELGGGDVAIATGVLLGATARRIPVLLDGPVGVAAGLVSRDLAGQARHWCLLPDHGDHPAVKLGADVLDLTPLLDLRLGLGEGAAALAALPLLRSALTLASTLPVHPTLATEQPDEMPGQTPDEARTPGDAHPPVPDPAEPWAPEPASDEPATDDGPAAPDDDGNHAGSRDDDALPPVPDPAEPWAPGPADDRPGAGDNPEDDREFVEPTPAGPGPTTVPENTATLPGNTATVPEGTATLPEDTGTVPEGTGTGAAGGRDGGRRDGATVPPGA
ncbi:bifunctional adenosylcobinamide kinase/adenosylcobinamide-phosphate guanylyltransferase [Micromonospora sp. WMMD1102]|nr:bifunctional adenosylcobinamide kinase/adenosylcobinamide-phosphate guanylyltransferase [Micromonospora sp. WMMD1102]MDG4788918.1 bifunctional adenosylcobinamide kinase/adenosylcobinamide-phosphate guanylyltransferase [Micromonospora sp. WMMD1102]